MINPLLVMGILAVDDAIRAGSVPGRELLTFAIDGHYGSSTLVIPRNVIASPVFVMIPVQLDEPRKHLISRLNKTEIIILINGLTLSLSA
jgi:hypothetical protein